MSPASSHDIVNFDENLTEVSTPPNPLSPRPRRPKTAARTGETPPPVVGRHTAYIPHSNGVKGPASAPKDPLFEALLNSLDRLYSAENLADLALPPLAAALSDPVLKDTIEHFLTLLPHHLQQLNLIDGLLGAYPRQGACLEMEAFIASETDVIHENPASRDRDFDLLCTALKILDYQVVSYGCTQNLATSLGLVDIAARLQFTLDEKLALVTKLRALADHTHFSIND